MSLALAHSALLNPLRQALAEAERKHAAADLARIHEMIATFLGDRAFAFPEARQRPMFGYFPGLTTRPFHDSAAWAPRLERHADVIREELRARLAEHELFQPYVSQGDSEARKARFGRGLKQPQDWTVATLVQGGLETPAAPKFPKTSAALADAFPGKSATTQEISYAVFSALKPGSHVVPHFGFSNIYLTCHLALIIPQPADSCRIRVGDETRCWEDGKVLAFDDTYEHEVWQDAEELRVVLLFWLFHPDLTPIEVEVLKSLVFAIRRALNTTYNALGFINGAPV